MFLRATYRPRGNGIVKRHHGTVRATAERSRISPIEVVFWYNISPRTRSIKGQRAVFKYEWLYPQATPMSTASEEQSSMQIGEEVWVKKKHLLFDVIFRGGGASVFKYYWCW